MELNYMMWYSQKNKDLIEEVFPTGNSHPLCKTQETLVPKKRGHSYLMSRCRKNTPTKRLEKLPEHTALVANTTALLHNQDLHTTWYHKLHDGNGMGLKSQ